MSGGIGVFVCRFAGGAQGNLDLDSLASFARSIPDVAWAKVIDEACRETSRREMVSSLRQGEVDRFVVAACSPMTQERRLMTIASDARLNPYMFAVANVREHSALVHSAEDAQRKAELLLAMAIAKCSLLAPAPFDSRVPESRSVLVLGDGVRASLGAEALAELQLETVIVSPLKPLRLPSIMDDAVARGLATAKGHEVVRGEVVEVDGAPGAFDVLIEGDEPRAVRCGAILVAFDPIQIRPQEGVEDLVQLQERLSAGNVPSSVVIIADRWKPEEEPPWLQTAMEAALRMKSSRKDCLVTIVARDIQAHGALESVQREAQRSGVRFVRSEKAPRTYPGPPKETLIHEQVLGPLRLRSELVIDLRTGRNEASERACQMLGIASRPDGTPRESRARLEAGESLKAGVFVFDPWTEWNGGDLSLDARAIVGRIGALLGSGIEEGGAVAQVEKSKCSACLACVRVCPYGAPRMDDDMKAVIRFELCQGCGMCVTTCPSKAIDMHCYSDQQLVAETHAALGGRR